MKELTDTAIGNPTLIDRDVEKILDLLVWYYCHAKFDVVLRNKNSLN